jgi:[acyl-carrier-protein] S-malonyltransferase
MARVALVFSGQGAQYAGMGRSLYERSPAAREVFARHEAIRPGTLSQCFDPGEALADTLNAQPCLYTVSLAAAAALGEAGIKPGFCAGFSLGEVSALAYAGVFAGDDGFRLVCRRAEFMHEAALRHPGGMAACLKLSSQVVEELCARVGGVYPANYNCPGQLVVSGDTEKIKELGVAAAQAGGRVLPLKVSGAFHSPFMEDAVRALEQELAEYSLAAPRLPLYANLTGERCPSYPAHLLAGQVSNPVLWEKSVRNMAADGASLFIEAGAGSVLCGLIKKIDGSLTAIPAENADGIAAAAELWAKERQDA